ncbi:protein of unknown function (plasmid) [Cupriavidus taiwanensis]|uniref:Uncharacterized protein n=2 Tax=Cupriavidus taiwanensis TaxID=164546 RepID=A0A375FM88_9BURK|nr:protein of unknown function [Cupriavidus taiwanensis]SOZ72444.1 protein of unknown function [Cupriavidus taiwanensis]SOZ74843.1 protein of unknown function [Cupriavidus taiwanensis]SPA03647.1 protein of unknown function [Cupriavidus taiwanensis]SPA11544.1 protein of unknown function [Cupriavidus taiwanensis]
MYGLGTSASVRQRLPATTGGQRRTNDAHAHQISAGMGTAHAAAALVALANKIAEQLGHYWPMGANTIPGM